MGSGFALNPFCFYQNFTGKNLNLTMLNLSNATELVWVRFPSKIVFIFTAWHIQTNWFLFLI